jgi:hypothetical protein
VPNASIEATPKRPVSRFSADAESKLAVPSGVTGRDVRPGQCNVVADLGEGSKEVVPPRLEQRVFGQRAGCDQAHDIAIDHGFRAAFLRVCRAFELFADRDAKTLADQRQKIAFGGMDRHPAHRDILPVMLAAFGERNVQCRGRFDRVIEEHLPMTTQRDLSLAYSPGVAVPCEAIAETPETVYDYTNKGNLVAVVSNGTAVLGLGNLGAAASKPVMEGKAVLFKRFADVNAVDIELCSEDPDEIIKAVKLMEPTFGGINLEDIKAPECFIIEQTLKEEMDIPVFHDDQHGTAVITAAGLINALAIAGKKMEDVKVVLNGAGAAGIACIELIKAMGARHDNCIVCDTKG